MFKPITTIAIGLLTSANILAADIARADKNFLEAAAQAGHTEVQASKLAQTKTANPRVKSFAETMVKDHTSVGADLDQLAASKNVKVPTGPSISQTARLKLMSTYNGEKFDKHYVKDIGVDAHEDTVELFRKAAKVAKDPDVKAFAEKTLPGLEHHLEMARALAADTKK